MSERHYEPEARTTRQGKLEAFPGLEPEVVGHLLPAIGGSAKAIGGVVVEELGGFLLVGCVEVLPGLFNHWELAQAFFEEMVAGGLEHLAIDAPAQRGKAVSLAELLQSGIVILAAMAALLQRGGQVGIAAEDGEPGALAGVVQCHPCHASDLVGQP